MNTRLHYCICQVRQPPTLHTSWYLCDVTNSSYSPPLVPVHKEAVSCDESDTCPVELRFELLIVAA